MLTSQDEAELRDKYDAAREILSALVAPHYECLGVTDDHPLQLGYNGKPVPSLTAGVLREASDFIEKDLDSRIFTQLITGERISIGRMKPQPEGEPN